MNDYPERKMPGDTLTVIIRNDAPMIHCGDSPTYRSVRITLTNEQLNTMSLMKTGSSFGKPMYEKISHVFLEPETEAAE